MLYKTATLLHTKDPKDLQLLGMGVERKHRYKFKIDTKDTTQEHRSISDLIVYSQHSSTTTGSPKIIDVFKFRLRAI